jgi:hypothetical protein
VIQQSPVDRAGSRRHLLFFQHGASRFSGQPSRNAREASILPASSWITDVAGSSTGCWW